MSARRPFTTALHLSEDPIAIGLRANEVIEQLASCCNALWSKMAHRDCLAGRYRGRFGGNNGPGTPNRR